MRSSRKPIPIIGTLSKDSDAILAALRISMDRYGSASLDCAPRYGNLEQVARAIRRLSPQRECLDITSKINFARQEQSTVDQSIREDIESIGIDYLDCYLIHSPRYLGYPATWLDLLKAQRLGLTKEIGVANFGFEELAKLPAPLPSVLQVSAFQYFSGHCPKPSSTLRVEVYGLISCFLKLPGYSKAVFSDLCFNMGLSFDEGILVASAHGGVIPVLGTSKQERLKQQLRAYDHGFERQEQGVTLTECLRRLYA